MLRIEIEWGREDRNEEGNQYDMIDDDNNSPSYLSYLLTVARGGVGKTKVGGGIGIGNSPGGKYFLR